MHFNKLYLFFLTLCLASFLCSSQKSFAKIELKDLPICTIYLPIGTLCRTFLVTLKPLQKPIGIRNVIDKAEKLHDLNREEYEEELIKNPLPLLIGLNQLHILDHHHFGSAIEYDLDKNRVEQHHVGVSIIHDNWNQLNKKNFVSRLIEKHYFYNRDENDKLITFDDLPNDLSEMKDDPYRSVAGDLRRMGGYDKKPDQFFLEFKWAHFLRNLKGEYAITPKDLIDDYEKAVKKAYKISQSEIAAHMPGFNGCNNSLNSKSKND